jgi:hypothetical protein
MGFELTAPPRPVMIQGVSGAAAQAWLEKRQRPRVAHQ